MRKGIHPEYHRATVRCTTCGAEFETGSVKKSITVDTCSNCHPFYTGKQSSVQADGRVDRFNKRFEASKVAAEKARKIAEEKAKREAEREAAEAAE